MGLTRAQIDEMDTDEVRDIVDAIRIIRNAEKKGN